MVLSYGGLRAKDPAVLVIEGSLLERQLTESGELAGTVEVRAEVHRNFGRDPETLEPAYYGGGFFWVVTWATGEYSLLDSPGYPLSTERVGLLREALKESISGVLLTQDEAHARAEIVHNARLDVLNQLFAGREVSLDTSVPSGMKAVVASIAEEPFCDVTGEHVELLPPSELDSATVSRIFQFILSGPVKLENLQFMETERYHDYVNRLIDCLPDIQGGFRLNREDQKKLRLLAPIFPSLWQVLSTPIAMITTHRSMQTDLELDESIIASDRNIFWEEVMRAVKSYFMNVWLRGYLCDHLGVAEIEAQSDYIIKSKKAVLASVTVETRYAIKQLADGLVGEAGTRHIIVRMLQHIPQPWDEEHPGLAD
jgi:hypothetical protein